MSRPTPSTGSNSESHPTSASPFPQHLAYSSRAAERSAPLARAAMDRPQDRPAAWAAPHDGEGDCREHRPTDGEAVMRRPRLPWLLRELLEAHRLIRQPYYVEGFRRCGIDIGGGLILGLAAVEVDDDNYMPAPGGKGALIIPYFAGNVLLDLIAVGLETFACRTRAGVCTVLGGEHIERAREQEMAVRLFKDPMDWLRNGRRGACIVDW